jgi:hypothetical protein
MKLMNMQLNEALVLQLYLVTLFQLHNLYNMDGWAH